MKKPVQEDMKLYSDAMKAPLFFSIVLHAMILLLFGVGMGLQGGSPGKVEVMYVSLVREPGPRSKIQDPRSVIKNSEVRNQNAESRSEEESLKVQPRLWRARRSTFIDIKEKSKIQGPKSKINKNITQALHSEARIPANELTTNNQQLNSEFRIQNSESKVQDSKPNAVTAYAGNSLPAGILGQGSETNAGLIYFPPVATTLPRPPYPLSSRRKGEEGTVTLSFLIYSDGTVGEILVVQSSGYPRLDKAASRSLRSAVFRPASESGLLVTSNRKIAFSFRLED